MANSFEQSKLEVNSQQTSKTPSVDWNVWDHGQGKPNTTYDTSSNQALPVPNLVLVDSKEIAKCPATDGKTLNLDAKQPSTDNKITVNRITAQEFFATEKAIFNRLDLNQDKGISAREILSAQNDHIFAGEPKAQQTLDLLTKHFDLFTSANPNVRADHSVIWAGNVRIMEDIVTGKERISEIDALFHDRRIEGAILGSAVGGVIGLAGSFFTGGFGLPVVAAVGAVGGGYLAFKSLERVNKEEYNYYKPYLGAFLKEFPDTEARGQGLLDGSGK